MMKIKRAISVLAMVGFVIGGAACSSNSKSTDDMSDAAVETMDTSMDESMNPSYDDASAEQQPIEEIAQDQSYSEPAPEETYDDSAVSEPYEENVSLGASSSGLGK